MNEVPIIDLESKQPWWNDKNKASGLAATIVMLSLAVAVAIITVSLGIWIGILILG